MSVNHYRQTFRFLGSGSTLGSWVVESTPQGPCGTVQLDRFEAEDVGTGSKKIRFWKYIARKAITNPNGQLALGGSCSGFDENSYAYDWRAKTHQQTCDYVEFSVF